MIWCCVVHVGRGEGKNGLERERERESMCMCVHGQDRQSHLCFSPKPFTLLRKELEVIGWIHEPIFFFFFFFFFFFEYNMYTALTKKLLQFYPHFLSYTATPAPAPAPAPSSPLQRRNPSLSYNSTSPPNTQRTAPTQPRLASPLENTENPQSPRYRSRNHSEINTVFRPRERREHFID